MKLPPTPANPPTGLPPPGRKWTDAQWSAIRADGRSLLVSAAAGSGKTSVLAERCAYLVCDAPEPCGVDQLLVVTFTESAATEMRDRIQKALRDRAARGGDSAGRLARQLALVEHAHVSTVHGFCARLLRQNFNLAGVDPHFHVIDADEAALMRLEVARDVFDRRYESDDAAAFHALLDGYADGRDEPLVDQVIHTHELLTSLIDPGDWLDRALARVSDAADKPLDESDLGRELLTAVDTALNRLERRCADAAAALKPLGINGYTARVTEWAALVLGWIDTFARHGIDALAKDVKSFEPARAPSVKADTPHKDLAKALLDSLKEQMQSGPLVQLLAFTETQWRHGQRRHRRPAGRVARPRPRVRRGVRDAEVRKPRVGLRRPRTQGAGGAEAGRRTRPRPLARRAGVPLPVPPRARRRIPGHQRAPGRDPLARQPGVRQGRGRVPGEPVHRGGREAERLPLPPRRAGAVPRPRTAVRACTDGTGEVIDLRENFRSRRPLLEAINAVFRRLMTEEAAEIEYDDSPPPPRRRLPSCRRGCFTGAPIELHVLPRSSTGRTTAEDGDERRRRRRHWTGPTTRRCSSPAASAQIDGRRTARPMQVCDEGPRRHRRPRRPDFGDVVILLRSHAVQGRRSSPRCCAERHPRAPARAAAGTSRPSEVRDVLALLDVLDNQRQDVPLAAVLRSPLAGLPEPETALARVRLAYPAPPAAGAVPPGGRAGTRRSSDDELAARLRDFFAHVSGWRD